MRTSVSTDRPNIFVKSNFSFLIENKPFNYVNQSISLHGISGLRWRLFDPRQIIGRDTLASIEVLAPDRFRFNTPGIFTAERTTDAQYLGVRFLLDKKVKAYLNKLIQAHGSLPTSHLRKYPRIPAFSNVSTMPLQVILAFNGNLISTVITNISPTGLLLRSENPKASFIEPGMKIKGQLEPRGDFYMAINFEALVCRVTEDYDPESRNITRYFGLRFLRFDEGHQDSFTALLKDVLLRLKEEI